MNETTNPGKNQNKIKYQTKCLALLSFVIMGFSPIAIAESNDDLPELPSITVKGQWAKHNLARPELTKVVKPKGIHKRMVGTKIHMYFRIGKNGEISQISSSASFFDSDEKTLGQSMKKVLRDWKFQPSISRTNGEPVAIRVAMPVVIVNSPGDKNKSPYAISGDIKDLTLLAVLE